MRRTRSGDRTPLLRMLAANSSSAASSNDLRGLVLDSTNSFIGISTYSFKVVAAFMTFSFFSNLFLILARQKQSCYGTICFGDDPQFFSCHSFVSAQETESMLKTSGVFLAVLLFQVAPIARMVTGKKLAWPLSSLLQCEQCARCCNDLPQSKDR